MIRSGERGRRVSFPDIATGVGQPNPWHRARRSTFRSRASSATTAVLILTILSIVGVPGSSRAVVIAGPDGSINSTAPDPDPGFANVGTMSSLTGVYVRNGWVLTAHHVGIGSIVLNGTVYEPVPDSAVRFTNPGVTPKADLIAFKLKERPMLPDLFLASEAIAPNDEVILIGNGNSRGLATTWMGYAGWNHGSPRSIRWGINRVESVDELALNTEAFSTRFTHWLRSHRDDPEAQAVHGDSGGAAFMWRRGTSELVGIIFARGAYEDQPSSTALFGNSSLMVDLDFYHDQIVAVVDRADCDDGIDDDGDGLIDFPEDPGCIDSLDSSEVPEPAVSLMLAAGVMALALTTRRRRTVSA